MLVSDIMSLVKLFINTSFQCIKFIVSYPRALMCDCSKFDLYKYEIVDPSTHRQTDVKPKDETQSANFLRPHYINWYNKHLDIFGSHSRTKYLVEACPNSYLNGPTEGLTIVGSIYGTKSGHSSFKRRLCEGSRRLHKHGEDPYSGLLLVESVY